MRTGGPRLKHQSGKQQQPSPAMQREGKKKKNAIVSIPARSLLVLVILVVTR